MSKRLDWESANSREKSRPAPVEKPIVAWWLTLTRNATSCHECGNGIPAGGEMLWNHGEGRLLCPACGEHLGIFGQPSKRLLSRR
jgi:hypothetical protein